MKKYFILLILGLNAHAMTQCFFDDGYALKFSKQECEERINSLTQAQGCYGFTLLQSGNVLVKDESARVLTNVEEFAGGEEIYISYLSNNSPDLKRAFSISLNEGVVSYLDPELLSNELIGECE